MPSGIKRLLGEGKLVRVFSTGQLLGPKLVEMVALRGGFDAFWLDHEHAGVTLEAVEQAVRAVRAAGLDSFVRMAVTDYASVMRFLEVGAGGIMAAHVRTAEEAERVVGFVKFPPRGRRGLNGSNRDGDFGMIPHAEYVAKCNRESFVAIQIENAEGLADVEAIARVPDVDLLFIGPADLSSSLGIVGQYDHPNFRAAMDRIIAVAGAEGLPWAPCPSAATIPASCSAAAAACWRWAATSGRSATGWRRPTSLWPASCKPDHGPTARNSRANPAVRPPSTVRIWPFMWLSSGSARNRTATAASSTSAGRPSGRWASIGLNDSWKSPPGSKESWRVPSVKGRDPVDEDAVRPQLRGPRPGQGDGARPGGHGRALSTQGHQAGDGGEVDAPARALGLASRGPRTG